MPYSCNHFILLRARLASLAKTFLIDQIKAEKQSPNTFSPDLNKIAAFILLFHAEIEWFLEAKAKSRLIDIKARLQASGQISRIELPEFFLLEKVVDVEKNSDVFLDEKKLKDHVLSIIDKCCKRVDENHGVKEFSFLFLSYCAGKSFIEIEINGALKNTLNSYGKQRGSLSHKSLSQVTNINSAGTEFDTAKNILKSLSNHFSISRL